MQSRSYHLVGLGAGLPQIKINIPADCGLEMTAANVVIFVFQSAVAPQDSYLRSFLYQHTKECIEDGERCVNRPARSHVQRALRTRSLLTVGLRKLSDKRELHLRITNTAQWSEGLQYQIHSCYTGVIRAACISTRWQSKQV